MNKIIHICFSESTSGSIKYALSKNLLEGNKVISFCDDLSHGPITDVNINSRTIWWNKILPKDEFEYIEDFKEEYSDLLKQIHEITDATVYMWYGENALFRIYENDKVISVSEDYLDEFILGYTNENFRKCARTVGYALGYSKTYVSDTFILWRILEMIKLGKIEYKGNFGLMREMEIKQAEGIYIRNHNKLVRDNIPEIIKADGKELKFRKLGDEEYLEELNEKLQEEIMEYSLNNDSVEELADIVEVIYAILEHKNIDLTEFEKIRLQKKNINGGFKEKLFLETVKKL